MARLTPPKSPIVYDKHHSGCMWGLYSLFDFRQGNSSRKLISDRKRVRRDVLNDDANVKRSNLFSWFDEKSEGNNDRVGSSVGRATTNEKKLKREETKSMHSSSELGQLPKDKGQLNKAGKSMDTKNTKKKRGCGCKNVDFVRYEEFLKVNDVAEAIVNQKLIEGKYLSRDGVNQQSKQLLDALEILNSNKELFTKLLQDPNSLLVKHIEELRDSQAQKQSAKSLSEAKALECESSNERHSTLESRGRCDDPRSSEIVVLKPGPISAQEEHVESVRQAYFSFGDMKRKFRHAMGETRKEPNLISIDGVKHGSPGENRRKFRNNNTENLSFDAQRSDKIEKLREFKARIGQEMASRSGRSNQRSTEPRHYSQTLNNKGEDSDFSRKQAPKLFQRAISSPEYDFLPLRSPGRDFKSDSVVSHMRFSPYGYSQVTYNNWRLAEEQKARYAGLLKQNTEAVSDRDSNPNEVLFKLDDTEKRDFEEVTSSGNICAVDTSNDIGEEATNILKEPCIDLSSDTANTNEETEYSESSRLDSSLEDQSSTCSSNVKDFGESSPVSVLEQFFVAVACPPSISCQPDEEQSSINLVKNTNTYGTISEYVMALSQDSGLNQDEHAWNSRESVQRFSRSFLDAVDPQANQFCGDCKLVFDCVRDVLGELHDAHFSHAPWLSYLNPKTLRPLEVEKLATQETTKRVEFFFDPESSSRRSVQSLIGYDLKKPGAWLDIRTDVEDIVNEIAEDALEEITMETIIDLCM